MNIKIFENEELIDFVNVTLTNFREETQLKKDIFSQTIIDFSSIKQLNGNKQILEKAFQNQKVEDLEL